MTAATALQVVQRTPEWIEARQHGVGASEAAAALGLSRWDSPYSLWARKCGLVPPKDATLPMRMGTYLEPFIATLYEAETGIPLRRVNRLLRSKSHPFLLASLDRRRPDGELVEIKWTERGDGYGEPGTDEIPDDVLCQVVQQMAVSGAPAVHVAVLRGGRFATYGPIRRDPEAEAALVERVAAFWRHVETRTAPPFTGSTADLDAIAARYPTDDGSIVMVGPEHPAALALAELRGVREAASRAKADETRLRLVIEAEMDESSTLAVAGVGKVTWKATRTSAATAWEAVARALGETDPAALSAAIASHTTPAGTGSRRFVPSWEGTPNE